MGGVVGLWLWFWDSWGGCGVMGFMVVYLVGDGGWVMVDGVW